VLRQVEFYHGPIIASRLANTAPFLWVVQITLARKDKTLSKKRHFWRGGGGRGDAYFLIAFAYIIWFHFCTAIMKDWQSSLVGHGESRTRRKFTWFFLEA
jgi:hypothetical protein